MALLSRGALTKPAKRRVERHPIAECGDDAFVGIQAMGAKDLLALQTAYGSQVDVSNTDFVFDLFARCLVGEAGEKMFADAADARETINLSLPALQDLVKACLAVSGVDTKEKN